MFFTRAPITAGNFLKYVDQRRLDNVKFYRTVKASDKFGFVQFGVAGDPKRILPPIAHERTDVTGVKHLNGAISTARFEPGSAREYLLGRLVQYTGRCGECIGRRVLTEQDVDAVELAVQL